VWDKAFGVCADVWKRESAPYVWASTDGNYTARTARPASKGQLHPEDVHVPA
jgi:hypothetical protein